MSSLEEIILDQRFDGAKSDLAHVRRQLIAAKDRFKLLPPSEVMTWEMKQQLCSEVYDKLVVLGAYNAALARRNEKALPVIEWFLAAWHREEQLIRITGTPDEQAIPGLWPPKLEDGTSSQPEGAESPPEQDQPMDVPSFEPPQKGQNSPIPPPQS